MVVVGWSWVELGRDAVRLLPPLHILHNPIPHRLGELHRVLPLPEELRVLGLLSTATSVMAAGT